MGIGAGEPDRVGFFGRARFVGGEGPERRQSSFSGPGSSRGKAMSGSIFRRTGQGMCRRAAQLRTDRFGFPLVIAHGAGAEMRRSLGVAVFSGMLGVTLFGIFLTPVF
jgi:hypothetical protein